LRSNPRLKCPKNQLNGRAKIDQRPGARACVWLLRIKDESAGESVSELKQEMTVATAIAIANCRKNWPEMPPRNAVGTNTADRTNAIEISAVPTSSMVRRAASSGLAPSDR